MPKITRLLFLVLLSPIPSFCLGQSYYKDAEWFYDVITPFRNKPTTITVIDSAEFNGKKYLRLKYDEQICTVINSNYIRSSADESEIFYYDGIDSKEYPLYDFSLTVDEIFILNFRRNGLIEKSSFRLDSIVSKSEFGTTYESQFFTQVDGYPLSGYEEVVIGVGGRRFLFPSDGACDAEDASNLRCFNSNGDFKKFVSYDCEDIVVGINSFDHAFAEIVLMQNKEWLEFKCASNLVGAIEIFNTIGQRSLTTKTGPISQIKINSNQLTRGLNFLRIHSETKTLKVIVFNK